VKQAVGRTHGCFAGRRAPAVLAAGPDTAAVADANDVRATIHQVQRLWATAALSATVPFSGTRLTASYGWTDNRVLMPDHAFLTQDVTEATGWNVRMRQPLPFFQGSGAWKRPQRCATCSRRDTFRSKQTAAKPC